MIIKGSLLMNLPIIKRFADNFRSPKTVQNLTFCWGFGGEKFGVEVGTPLPYEINPHRTTSFDTKRVAILPEMCSPELCKTSAKK